MLGDEFRQARIQPLCLVDREQIAADKVRTRGVETVAANQPRHHRVTPADLTLFIQPERRRRRRGERPHTGFDLFGKTAPCRRQNGGFFVAFGQRRPKDKAVKNADLLAFDQHRTVTFHRGHQIPCFLQLAAQMCGAPVNEPFRKPFMKAVGKPVLDRARPILPFGGVVCPVRTMCDVGPCADIGKTRHQCIDIAVQPVELRHRLSDHVIAEPAMLGKLAIEIGQKVIMIIIQALPEIGDTGHIPQQTHLRRADGAVGNHPAFGQNSQGAMVDGISLAEQERHRRRHLERGQEIGDR